MPEVQDSKAIVRQRAGCCLVPVRLIHVDLVTSSLVRTRIPAFVGIYVVGIIGIDRPTDVFVEPIRESIGHCPVAVIVCLHTTYGS